MVAVVNVARPIADRTQRQLCLSLKILLIHSQRKFLASKRNLDNHIQLNEGAINVDI